MRGGDYGLRQASQNNALIEHELYRRQAALSCSMGQPISDSTKPKAYSFDEIKRLNDISFIKQTGSPIEFKGDPIMALYNTNERQAHHIFNFFDNGRTAGRFSLNLIKKYVGSTWNGDKTWSDVENDLNALDNAYKKEQDKNKKETKPMINDIFADLKQTVKDNRKTLYSIALVVLLDHFVFKGFFREKLKAMFGKVVGCLETKVDKMVE